MIRKHASFVFPLSEYVSRAELSEKGRERIERAVSRRENILIAGGTGSGKTTFANAVLLEVAKADDRIVIIEDTRELQCSARDSVTLRAREGVADMATLLRATMRLRPDRIVIGEVRGPEVLTMLKAWNTGHPGGCATVHADSGRRALTRLEHLLLECGIQSGKHLVGEAVQLVVYMEKTAAGRRVKEILEVGFDGKAYEFNEVL